MAQHGEMGSRGAACPALDMVLPPTAVPYDGGAPSTRSGARRPLHQDDDEEQQAGSVGRGRGMTTAGSMAPTGASAGARAGSTMASWARVGSVAASGQTTPLPYARSSSALPTSTHKSGKANCQELSQKFGSEMASFLSTYAVMKSGGGTGPGAQIDAGHGDLGGQGAPPPLATSTLRKEATRLRKPEEDYHGKEIKDRKVEGLREIAQTEFAAAIMN